MYGYTFRDVVSGVIPPALVSPALWKIQRELERANRSYSHDAQAGNYLEDFLQAHGDEDAVPIEFIPSSPHCAGRIVALDLWVEL